MHKRQTVYVIWVIAILGCQEARVAALNVKKNATRHTETNINLHIAEVGQENVVQAAQAIKLEVLLSAIFLTPAEARLL